MRPSGKTSLRPVAPTPGSRATGSTSASTASTGGRVSGFKKRRMSPRARRAPALLPPANPRLRPVSTSVAVGRARRTSAAVPSRLALSTMIVSSGVYRSATNATAGTVTVPGSYPTIQAAINGAPAGSVIQIQPGHYHERLNLTSIRRTITLRGDPANPASVIVDGDGGGDTVRMRDCGANVVVDGITVTGGRGGNGGYGGGLFVADATAVFRHCV